MSSYYQLYEVNNRFFKVAILLSLGLHLILTMGIFFFSNFNKSHILNGPVYTINLVNMPSHGVVDLASHLAPTAGSISIPNSKPVPVPHKDIKMPKIKPMENIPVIKPVTSEPKAIPQPKITMPSTHGLPGKINNPGGPILGAVKGETNPTGAMLPGNPQAGNSGSNIPGAIPFPAPDYLQVIQTQITNNWNPPRGILGQKSTLTLMVLFSISRKGKIEKIQIEDSSGSVLLDDSALRAVQLCNPFPPIPSVVKEDLLQVHFQFTYTNKN